MSGLKPCVILFTYFLIGVIVSVEAARILVVVPTPMYSHQVVFQPYIKELLNREHHVVVLTTDPAYPSGENPQNLTEINLHDLSYKLLTEMVKKVKQQRDFNKQIPKTFHILADIFVKQMLSEKVRKLVSDKQQQFDLIVSEAYLPSTLVLAHFYRAPAILISTCGLTDEMYEEAGVPIHPTLYPDTFQNVRYSNLPWEQAKIVYQRIEYHYLSSMLDDKYDDTLKDMQVGEVPSLQKLKTSVDAHIANLHPVWVSNRPSTPSVAHLGGLHSVPPKPLPEDLKSMMDSSERGVIYMSFGSHADPSLLPPERMAIFARVFASLPYDILWKWKNAPENLPSNVRTFSWLPQPDLLRHKNVLLFITQGGLQSTDEALRAGVPLLAIPLWADQGVNAENYERLGVGIRLDLFTLTETQLKEAIETLIYDKSFREKSTRWGRIMQDRPQSSIESAIWWSERVIRLRGRKMPTQPPPLTWDGLLQALTLAALVVPVSLIFLTNLLYRLLSYITRKVVIIWRHISQLYKRSSKILHAYSE